MLMVSTQNSCRSPSDGSTHTALLLFLTDACTMRPAKRLGSSTTTGCAPEMPLNIQMPMSYTCRRIGTRRCTDVRCTCMVTANSRAAGEKTAAATAAGEKTPTLHQQECTCCCATQPAEIPKWYVTQPEHRGCFSLVELRIHHSASTLLAYVHVKCHPLFQQPHNCAPSRHCTARQHAQ